jgi:hypothetical protein
MILGAGLPDILTEVNGVEVTCDLIYMNFYRLGETSDPTLILRLLVKAPRKMNINQTSNLTNV